MASEPTLLYYRKVYPSMAFGGMVGKRICLVGTDNENDYQYLGKLDAFTGQMAATAKSCRPADSLEVRLLNRVLASIWTDDHQAYQQHGYETHHEGKCCRCGRKLTVPSSIESGWGPECIKLARAG